MSLLVMGAMDPSGGAGLLRDLWSLAESSPSTRVHAVATALTWQGRGRPAHADPVDSTDLGDRLGALTREYAFAAVKVGLISDTQIEVIRDVLDLLRRSGARIVLDPVMFASDGGSIGASARGILALAEVVDLLTPNPSELAMLGPSLPCLTLCKSHSIEGGITDRLVYPDGRAVSFTRERRLGPDPRGTGCALASAIAGGFARGLALEAACATAITWLDQLRARVHPSHDGRHHLDVSAPGLGCLRD